MDGPRLNFEWTVQSTIKFWMQGLWLNFECRVYDWTLNIGAMIELNAGSTIKLWMEGPRMNFKWRVHEWTLNFECTVNDWTLNSHDWTAIDIFLHSRIVQQFSQNETMLSNWNSPPDPLQEFCDVKGVSGDLSWGPHDAEKRQSFGRLLKSRSQSNHFLNLFGLWLHFSD